MKLGCIIDREAGIVSIDGDPRPVDTTSLPKDVEVINWSVKRKSGWIQFKNNPYDLKPYEFKGNETITSIAPYQSMLDEWQETPDASDENEMAMLEVERGIIADQVKHIEDSLKTVDSADQYAVVLRADLDSMKKEQARCGDRLGALRGKYGKTKGKK